MRTISPASRRRRAPRQRQCDPSCYLASTETPFSRDLFTDSRQPVEQQKYRCETTRNALRGLSADKAGGGTLLQFYLTEFLINVTVPIRQPDNLCGKKVRVTVTGSLTRNRQGIY